MPAWARASQAQSQHRAPTEDNSDSDDDGSEMGEGGEKRSGPFSLISKTLLASVCIFGADGNLASKKILPTLFTLWKRRLVPRDILIFGYARSELTTESFRKFVFRCIYNPSEAQVERKEFLKCCHFVSGQFNDETHVSTLLVEMQAEEAKRIATRPHAVDHGEQVRMYYMAVPPFLYADICSCLRSGTAAMAVAAGDGAPGGVGIGPAPKLIVPTRERFVLEKPFGRDTESCGQMVRELAMLHEEEIYRIDHYLGKELVMNLLVLRFANVAFQSIWNRQCIKSVQIIFKEDYGTEGRGGYFDEYGMIRDVMQNHLLQVMALVAMEQPLDFTAENIMAEKLKVLKACGPLTMDDLVIGQYVRCGKHPGYLEDPTISNKGSLTETFAAGVLHVHTPRWDGVPFVLKAGKALTDRKAEVRIQFHKVPGAIPDFADVAANELVVQLQPQQTIYWKVMNKVPGLKFQVQQMRMDLVYASKFDEKKNPMPEAYERLLLEAFAADHSHFVSAQELDASWRIFTPILRELADKQVKPHPYPYGSRGPAAQDGLAQRYGLTKFGGGVHPYVHGGAVKPSLAGDDFHEGSAITSNSSAALRSAASSSLMQVGGAAAATDVAPSGNASVKSHASSDGRGVASSDGAVASSEGGATASSIHTAFRCGSTASILASTTLSQSATRPLPAEAPDEAASAAPRSRSPTAPVGRLAPLTAATPCSPPRTEVSKAADAVSPAPSESSAGATQAAADLAALAASLRPPSSPSTPIAPKALRAAIVQSPAPSPIDRRLSSSPGSSQPVSPDLQASLGGTIGRAGDSGNLGSAYMTTGSWRGGQSMR